MEYVNLGRTGLKVSRICLGTMTYGTSRVAAWVLDEGESRPFYRRALELGINFFDTADMYSLRRQRRDHRAGAARVSPGGKKWSSPPRCSTRWATGRTSAGCRACTSCSAIDDSLRRLGTDYVDLYQIHRYDPQTPIEETLEALHDVVKAGKARYIGASSMYAWQFAQALYLADQHGWTRFVSMQNHYNLVYREEEARDDAAVPGGGDWGDPVEPAGARLPDRRPQARGYGETTRAADDDYAQSLYYQESGLRDRRPGGRAGRAAAA